MKNLHLLKSIFLTATVFLIMNTPIEAQVIRGVTEKILGAGPEELAENVTRALPPTIASRAWLADTRATLQTSFFIKDILRNNIPKEVYTPQIQQAKSVYAQIADWQKNPPAISQLQQQIQSLSSVQETTRYVWLGILKNRWIPQEKYTYLLERMKKYFDFDTANDAETIILTDKLLDNQRIQLLRTTYNSFTDRLERFSKEHHRLPTSLSFATAEEKGLASELEIFKFFLEKDNFYPINMYIKRIKNVIETYQ